MVNITKLREAMRKAGLTPDTVSDVLHIDRATFYRRIAKKGTTFTVSEVSTLSELLKLPPQEMQEIFFDRELA